MHNPSFKDKNSFLARTVIWKKYIKYMPNNIGLLIFDYSTSPMAKSKMM